MNAIVFHLIRTKYNQTEWRSFFADLSEKRFVNNIVGH